MIRGWLPTPVFVPGEFQGQRSLAAAVHGTANSWTQVSKCVTNTFTFIAAFFTTDWIQKQPKYQTDKWMKMRYV